MTIKTKFKNIIITGGAGFIGGNLICKLINEDYANIFNIDKLGFSSDLTAIDLALNNNEMYFSHKYKLFNIDLIEKNKLNKVFELANPDLVIHLAAESHVDRSIDNPEKFVMSNVIGTLNILEASLIHFKKLDPSRKKIFRFHHVSTDEVFGSLSELSSKFDENTKYDPRSPYSASKAASDHLVRAWNHTYNLPISISNCSNNYGPWQYPEKLIPVVLQKAINLEKIPLYGNGENIRDWLHVDDHINAILLIVNNGDIGANYCIGGSNEIKNKDLIKMICEYLDWRLPKEFSYKDLITHVNDRPGHDYRYAINSSLIKDDLDWNSNISFKDGLSNTIDWYLKNLDWVDRVIKKYS
tara:strand:- start:2025 stop:3089 length:1065 start_codon:yes stop_codon:yes gene_type:complete